MKKTILMSGATGFLGSNILKILLKRNYKVVILKRSFSDVWRIKDIIKEVKYFNLGEISIEDIFQNVDVDIILHCATNYGRGETDLFNVIEANLLMPLRLLEIGKKNGVKCFINTDTILDKRVNYYSLSKSQFKSWLEMNSDNLICINVLLEHFYGPFDDKTKFVSLVVDKLLSDAERIDFTKGEQKRDFIYIDDVVGAFSKILDNAFNLKKGFYNYEIGTNDPVEIKQFVKMIQKISGNSKTKLNFGAIPYRKNEVMVSKVDVTEITKLGWKPRYSLKEGLAETIKKEKIFRVKT
jgi:CDP-paratose synthetase